MLNRIGKTGLALAFAVATGAACGETGPTQPDGTGAEALAVFSGETETLDVAG